MKLSPKARLALIVIPVILIFDQWSKWWVLKNFRLGESHEYIKNFFAFTYVQNRGAAFSFLHSAPDSFRKPFFFIVPLLILGFLIYLFVKLRPHQKLSAFSLALIAGGAVGNLIDRVQYGYVVDFIHFHWKDVYHYPMFNIADSGIVVGAILYWISTLKKD